MNIERRSLAINLSDIELKAEGSAPLPAIRGYTTVFDQEIEIKTYFGAFRETIRPGAFSRVLGENPDVRALFNHDPNNVLARSTNQTLTLRQDSRGLYIEVRPSDTTVGRDVVALIERGDVTGMSFAFTIARVRWEEFGEDEDELDMREILEIDQLYDVGPVTYPAYDQTTAEVMRMNDWEAIKNERDNYLLTTSGGAGTTTNDLVIRYQPPKFEINPWPDARFELTLPRLRKDTKEESPEVEPTPEPNDTWREDARKREIEL